MKRQFILMFLILGMLILATGCQGKTNKNIAEVGEITFAIVDPMDLESERLIEWYEEYYTQGILSYYDYEEHTYILVSEGEKPTGGYELNMISIVGEEENIKVKTELISPSKDDLVTQAITYPNLLVRIKKDERKILWDEASIRPVKEINNDGSNLEIGINEKTDLIGTYVGQIDNNSIEIIVEGEPMTFHIGTELRESFDNNPPKKDSQILFLAYRNENGQWIITSIVR